MTALVSRIRNSLYTPRDRLEERMMGSLRLTALALSEDVKRVWTPRLMQAA